MGAVRRILTIIRREMTMALQRLEKLHWTGWCERMTPELLGKWAEIEVASRDYGVQLEARWLPVVGVAYDPHDDLLEILLDGLDHLIPHPREMYVDLGPAGVESLGIVDQAGTWQIVSLRDPLKLPPPEL
jgi:Family of unknown function (DUF5335)